MKVDTIGIIGYGHFGTFIAELTERFLPEIEVRVYSRRATADNELFFELPQVAACDVVVFCSAIFEYKEQLMTVLPHLAKDTVLIDVATVKKYTTEIFREYASDRHWVSCHPMFGPESYQKTGGDVSGFRVVVTDHTLINDDYVHIKDALTRLGFLVVEMTADEHDTLLAETLFLTHYIAQSIDTAGFGRTDIDTVSFNSLMNAVQSVLGDKQLFEDVYQFNPYCQEVAERFRDAQEQVYSALPRTHRN